VEKPVGWLKRGFAVATGFSARLSSHLRTPANAKVTARGQAGGLVPAAAHSGGPRAGAMRGGAVG